MSPRWMVNRVSELDRIGQRHTAVQMVRALRAGRIHAVTIVVDSTGEILENAIIDHTHEWVRAFSGPNPEIKLPSWIGESELPHVGNPAVKNRHGPSAAVADAGEAGALASGEGRSIAVREGAEVAVREGAEVASQRIALRTAARTVGRVLVAVIGRLLMALDVLGLAFLITEIVGVLVAYFSDRAIERAIEKATRTNIPVEIKAALDQYKDEIARHFARAWHNKKNADDAIFLYLSPRLVIEGGLGNDGFVFTVSVPVKSFEKDLVSTRFIEPNRKDIVPLGPTYYNIEIRWSAEQPIFTPFDIYLAFTEYFVEHVVDSWTMHYANNVKLAPSTVELFRSTVEILAEISATLKFEPWFGSDGLDFPTSKVGVARWKALQELSVTYGRGRRCARRPP
jgi:hypothetical protein